MIVLDASVLIGHLDPCDTHHAAATALLSDASGEEFAASPVSLAEVLVAPARSGRLDLAVAALAQLQVITVELPSDAPTRLALLRAGTGLKLPDCCVLLAAETADADVATFDKQLGLVAERHGFKVYGATAG